MASAKVGVVTAAEVNGPISMNVGPLLDPSSASFWACVWFLVALVLLFFVL